MENARVIRTLRSGAFNVQTVEFGSGFSVSENVHQRTCLQVVLRGRLATRGQGAGDWLGAGTLVYRPAGAIHRSPSPAAQSVSLCIQLSESALDDVLPAGVALSTPQIVQSAGILAIAERIGEELERPDDLTPMVVDAACLQLLSYVVRRSRNGDRPDDAGLVRRVRALVEGRRGARLRVEALAGELEVSRHRLNRSFVRVMGCSVSTYLRRYRLFEARRLLEETRAPIAEIAFLTGFADQSHLTRQFQAFFGRTPARVRSAVALADLGRKAS